MAATLFYHTSPDEASAILTGGFRGGGDGLVWLSEETERPDDPVASMPRGWAEPTGSSLLAVALQLSDAELSAYAVNREHPARYALPAGVVNARGLARLVTANERERMELGLPD